MRMQFRSLVLLLAVVTAGTSMASAQDIIPKVRYKGGHAGWAEDEIRGSLMIGDTTVTFQDDEGKRTLTIPVRNITEVAAQTQRKEASVGSKLLFGKLARSRQEEFVQVSYDLPDNAEAITFRFEPNTSAAAMAKIKFRMRKMGVAPPATTETAPVTEPAQ
ncbi:MAG: hypothetical protein ABI765_06530 [Gemmatimonadota bacterium]